MRVTWAPQALSDLADAVAWYDLQEHGRGEDLVGVLTTSLALLQAFPRSFPIVVGQLRRVALPRFPYSLFYRVSAGRIEVAALFHQSTHPRRWSDRVNEPAPEYAAA